MNAQKLREMSDEELDTRLVDAKRELFNLRFQLATNQLDNTARLGQVKKDIARILSVARESEIKRWAASQLGEEGA